MNFQPEDISFQADFLLAHGLNEITRIIPYPVNFSRKSIIPTPLNSCRLPQNYPVLIVFLFLCNKKTNDGYILV